jgi:hypothetical protein
MSRQTVQFKAKGSDGLAYTVYASRPSLLPDDSAAERAGAYTPFWTEGGQAVARVVRGRYRVVGTGVTLTSDDPEAP